MILVLDIIVFSLDARAKPEKLFIGTVKILK